MINIKQVHDMANRSIDKLQTWISKVYSPKIDATTKVVCYGCLAGSAVGSLVLVESRLVWYFDVSIFAIACAGTVALNLLEMKTYSLMVLPCGTLFCLGIYSVAHNPIKDLVQGIPAMILLFIFITVYSMPRLFPRRMPSTVVQVQDDRSIDPVGWYSDPGFFQRAEENQNRADPIASIMLFRDREQNLEQDLAYIGRASSPLSEISHSNESDIDLEAQMESTTIALQRMVSPNRAAFFGHTRTFPQEGIIAAPSQPFRYHDGDKFSSSGNTQKAQGQSQVSAKSDTPLLA